MLQFRVYCAGKSERRLGFGKRGRRWKDGIFKRRMVRTGAEKGYKGSWMFLKDWGSRSIWRIWSVEIYTIEKERVLRERLGKDIVCY